MENKGHEFKGLAGGANYKRFASLVGINEEYYRKCLDCIKLRAGMRALDLGCGPGALCYALAEKAEHGSEIIGIDISEDQLNYARNNTNGFKCSLDFKNLSMDQLSFPDAHFDIVMSSMALHETPPPIRRAALAETARVLKSGGLFILIDWSKPKAGFLGVLWYIMLKMRRGADTLDNWHNTYPDLCENQNMIIIGDTYLNSIARRQIFEKGIN